MSENIYYYETDNGTIVGIVPNLYEGEEPGSGICYQSMDGIAEAWVSYRGRDREINLDKMSKENYERLIEACND